MHVCVRACASAFVSLSKYFFLCCFCFLRRRFKKKKGTVFLSNSILTWRTSSFCSEDRRYDGRGSEPRSPTDILKRAVTNKKEKSKKTGDDLRLFSMATHVSVSRSDCRRRLLPARPPRSCASARGRSLGQKERERKKNNHATTTTIKKTNKNIQARLA